jgi:hypothetical protein
MNTNRQLQIDARRSPDASTDFARIPSLPSLSGTGNMLAGTGIPFCTLRGELAYGDNRVVLDGFLAYGQSAGQAALPPSNRSALSDTGCLSNRSRPLPLRCPLPMRPPS